jgi:hypothetical protein
LDVVEERERRYGQSWKTTGEILSFFFRNRTSIPKLFSTHYVFNWIMILNKLNRILSSPDNPDHWLDIAGYATLVYEEAKDKEEVKDEAKKDLPSE